ncbi:hypothetical protein ACCO45_012739 [Purpureocillium lilacinum]|uniref:Uncharacterized protein n=1 Tax=Purpureocillium lilacinum TaxID=33203 RepID=A0ACC4DBF5_PURLI
MQRIRYQILRSTNCGRFVWSTTGHHSIRCRLCQTLLDLSLSVHSGGPRTDRSGACKICPTDHWSYSVEIYGISDGMLRMTYRLACNVLEDPSTPKESAQLLGVVLRTWTSIRLLTLPAFVVDEQNPELRQNKDLIPVPPATLREELMGRLQNMMKGNRKENWLVVYLTTFVLLHNTALLTACKDDTVSNHKVEASVSEFDVSETYHEANILLGHFHYFSRGLFPVMDNFQEQTLRRVAGLDEKQTQVILHCANLADVHEHEWDKLDEHDLPNSYFFISQLFEVSWKPRSVKYG